MIIRKLEALFTINTNAIQFKRATDQLDHLAEKVQNVMSAIAGYWAVQALQNFVINTSNAMAELGKTSQYLGVIAQGLQELRYAAEKSGVSIDALDDSLKELQVRAFDARSGQGEAAEAFNILGVNAMDALGHIKEPLALLDEVADKFLQLPKQSDRLWVADAIFGDEGATILKMLNEGSLGLNKMRKEAQSLGLALDQSTIAKANELNVHLTRLRFTSQGITNTFVSSLLPGITWLAEKCATLSAAFNSVDHRASMVRVSLASLAVVITGLIAKLLLLFAPVLLKITLIGAAIAGIAFVIEDIWVAFRGGDSVLRNLQQKIRDFFTPLEKWLLDIPNRFMASIKAIIDSLNDLIPDFIKQGLATTIKHIMPKELSESEHDHHQLNTRLAPTTHNISNQRQLTQNQKVSVNVNVKSGAHPHDIGSEVAKAVRDELEKERVNAFMGIYNYAG